MHVVTFYSFKGGVGRTLALVNVGIELAKNGRKVLLIDFDLEAPGIDTFDDLKPKRKNAGVVDFITDYLITQKPPEFKDYCYKTSIESEDNGALWVMPAGKRDTDYGSRLGSIDWKDLYAQREGFLLLENLKHQWESTLQPDYVLIDSRTGHTEVGGVCTRQLPDTVVVMFIPNEQNLAGVSSVVDAIREENETSRKNINVELVASNVPSLDDEHEVLRKMMRKFEKRLGRKSAKPRRSQFTTINRYDSMHLLDQAVFVTARPKSSLAKQYRMLMQKIVAHNLDDREAAMRVITRRFPHPSRSERFIATDFEPFSRLDDHQEIHDILNRHPDDAEIFHMVGQLYKGNGELDEAESFFARAAKLGSESGDPKTSKYKLELLETQVSRENPRDVRSDLMELLEHGLSKRQLRQAISLLIRVNDTPSDDFFASAPLLNLSVEDIGSVASVVSTSRSWQRFVAEKLKHANVNEVNEAIRDELDLVLIAIGGGEPNLVVSAINFADAYRKNDIATCFNYAIAKWMADHNPDANLFRQILEIESDEPLSAGANYEQCLAVASYLSGDFDHARIRLRKAKDLAEGFMFQSFSCWRYLLVNQEEFVSDLNEIENFIKGGDVTPHFMR